MEHTSSQPIRHLLTLPMEIRSQIYELLMQDEESSRNETIHSMMLVGRQVHDEFEHHIYHGRNLVFDSRPGCLAETPYRWLSVSMMDIRLEHPRKPAINLPFIQRWCHALRGNKKGSEQYAILPWKYFRGGKIVYKIYESPREDRLQSMVSYWCTKLVSKFLETYPGRPRLQVIAQPLSSTSNAFTKHIDVLESGWNERQYPDSMRERMTGDISFILAPFWYNTNVILDVHTTMANSNRLLKYGFVQPERRIGSCTRSMLGHFQGLTDLDKISPYTNTPVIRHIAFEYKDASGINHLEEMEDAVSDLYCWISCWNYDDYGSKDHDWKHHNKRRLDRTYSWLCGRINDYSSWDERPLGVEEDDLDEITDIKRRLETPAGLLSLLTWAMPKNTEPIKGWYKWSQIRRGLHEKPSKHSQYLSKVR